MTPDRQIIPSPDGQSVMVENGPMRLTIKAWAHGVFQMEQVIQAARFSFTCLEQVAAHLPDLKTSRPILTEDKKKSIPIQMIKSVHDIGDKMLTPMAAVAGSIADAVADQLFCDEISKVIVDNGGDIAIRLSSHEKVKIGLRTNLNTTDISHTMELTGRHASWGVNTSGMGGRSFTSGIASAATAIGKTSSIADAAATSIANACYVMDKNIVQVPARDIDPSTDIPDIPVTVRIKYLTCETIRAALEKSLIKAENYITKGLIYGAVIAAGPYVVITRGFNEQVGFINTQPGCSLIKV